jgi:PKD repeat protein
MFDGSGSIAEGTIVSYGWDFGDGTTADGERVEHIYQEPGYYPVTLTVINDLGLKDTTLPLWFFAIAGGVSCY